MSDFKLEVRLEVGSGDANCSKTLNVNLLRPFLVDKAAIRPATKTNSNVEQVRAVGGA